MTTPTPSEPRPEAAAEAPSRPGPRATTGPVHRLQGLLTAMLVVLVGIMAAEALWLRASGDAASASTWGGLLTIGAVGALAMLLAGRQLERYWQQLLHRHAAVDAAHDRQTAIWNALPAGVVVHGPDGAVREANPQAHALLGLPRDRPAGETLGASDWPALDADGRPLDRDAHPAALTLRTGVPIRGRLTGVVLPDGSRRWLRVSTASFEDAQRQPNVVAGFVDVTEAVTQRRLLELTVEAAGLGTWDLDLRTGDTSFNARCAQLLGLPAVDGSLSSAAWQALIHPADAGPMHAALRAHLVDPARPYRAEYRMRHADGHWVWLLATGAVVGRDEHQRARRLAGVHVDVSERRRVEQAQALAASTDALTGLANRASLQERLGAALTRRGDGTPRWVGLLFLDFDHFKEVNDRFGHAAGDELLRQMAQRLRAALRPGDGLGQFDGIAARSGDGADADPVAARLGGDEFVVLLQDLEGPDSALGVAHRLLLALRPAYEIEGRTVCSSASIGVATCEGIRCAADELLRRADRAMYEAKRSGRARAVEWREDLDPATPCGTGSPEGPWPVHPAEAAVSRLRTGRLPALTLRYRPIVCLPELRPLAWIAEAHLADSGPDGGPDTLPLRLDDLALADDHALHRWAGEWTLAQATHDLARLPVRQAADGSGALPVPVLLPLSRAQWRDPALPDHLAAVLQDRRLPAGSLRLAVSEAVATEDDSARAALDAVRAAGAWVALTSFGSGSASLANLDHLDLCDVLLDGGFITRIADSDYQRTLVQAVQSVCQALDLRLAADGVATAEQVQALVRLGCTAAAGPLFGAPRTLDAVLRREALDRPMALR